MSDKSKPNLRRLLAGQKLAHPPPGEEVVISGMSGSFPNSETVNDFIDNIMNKVDLCDEKPSRWPHNHQDIPRLAGKLISLERFDAGYFGVHKKDAKTMDIAIKLLLQKTIEAIMDAGINPNDLRGTNTGVFIGYCYMESEIQFYNDLTPNSKHITSNMKSMLANRISYFLQINGPCVVMDTACSSGLYSFECAYRAIREGKCDRAIVASGNVLILPGVSLQFSRLGVLNMNTGCRPFDDDGLGYTRSEAMVSLFLQKKKEANKIYAKVLHSKTNVDGFKHEGITFPSGKTQVLLLKNIYEECGVDPTTLDFLEAHGTGTIVGDPEELNAADLMLTPGRNNPLLIGSIKGNIGHSEPTSGLCAVIKVLIAMHTGVIPPNIHYENPRKKIDALIQNRFKVVTEKTPWPARSNLGGVNCFGFGGANSHALLKRNEKQKSITFDNLPRLVCFSGRNIEAIKSIQGFLKTNKLNYECMWLVQNIFRTDIENHLLRGFSIIQPNGEIINSSAMYDRKKHLLHLNIGNFNKYSLLDINEFSQIKNFSNTIESIKQILLNSNIDLSLDKEQPQNILQQVMYATCMQLGLINILKVLNIPNAYVTGSSIGQFTSAYANDCLSLKEVVLSVYHVTKILLENKTPTKDIHNKLLNKLNELIPKKLLNSKNSKITKGNNFEYSSAEYFIYNILNPIATTQTLDVDKNTIILNVDQENKLNKRKNQSLDFIKPSMKINDLLINIGKLYELGFQPDVQKLYPDIKTPLSCSAPILSSFIKWKEEKYPMVFLSKQAQTSENNEKNININVNDANCAFYTGHVIDGRNLFPATGYLYLIWELFAENKAVLVDSMRVCFENIKLLRATTIGANGKVNLDLSIHKDGLFEVSENAVSLVTGKISEIKSVDEYSFEPSENEGLPEMKHKDIYKEIRLRGYNYRGSFRAIQNISGTTASIKWEDNWVTFVDNMLQLMIIQEDSRSLYVPVGIDKLVIDAPSHLKYMGTVPDKNVPLEFNKTCNIVKSKFVQIWGLKPAAISRKRQLLEPVLENYKFVSNNLITSIKESVRINVQVILENKNMINVKILEDLEEGLAQPLSEELYRALADLPLIQPDITVISKNAVDVEIQSIKIQTSKADTNFTNLIYIGYNLLTKEESLQHAAKTIVDGGFIISVEKKLKIYNIPDFIIYTKHQVDDKVIYLLRKKKEMKKYHVINIGNTENVSVWIEEVKQSFNYAENIVLYAQYNSLSGILGFVNCIRQEPGGDKVRCVFIQGDAPKFDINNNYYKDQLNKGMAVNVLNNNNWGTYRHVLLKKTEMKHCKHYYADNTIRGDLSSLKWVEGYLSSKNTYNSNDLIYVHYAAINFKDIMIASGKIPAELQTKNRRLFNRLLGFEFSGITGRGQRVMGISDGSITNILEYKSSIPFEIPLQWSMEEAATIPAIYLTALYALHTRANLKRGQSILIHSGTGGVGQAAINICSYFDCQIFTTVGNEAKTEYLLQNYPNLKRSHIGSSRNNSFEEMIFKQTNGKGVDIVLNSLAEDKLHTSAKCLATGGTFLEIGKFDINNDNNLCVDLSAKQATFYGIMLDRIFLDIARQKNNLIALLKDGIDKGYVKPIPRTIFKKDQLEDAFRFMITGNHMGKVLINIGEQEENVLQSKISLFKSIPRFYGDPHASYIILGGLGGFGLEMADWLILRGAKSIIFSSRTGITDGYQKLRERIWNSYGVQIKVSMEDITTYEGCESLIKEANKVAPVVGIFNLAVILKDAILSNQNKETMRISLGPKAIATKHLDELSRNLCPALKYFVVFSSVSCGRGNAGQCNYGFSNSVMERICEKRKVDGLPGLAIQWGAVGDVGLVAEMQQDYTEIAIGGTLQQRITSCLEVMDTFLDQNEPVVSSIVVAEKADLTKVKSPADAVCKIIGIKNMKTVGHHCTLSELGMDSMMSVEIRQTLERDFDIFLSAQDMRNLTFARLQEFNNSEEASDLKSTESPKNMAIDMDIKNIVKSLSDLPLVDLCSKTDTLGKVLFFPGVDGNVQNFSKMGEVLKYESKLFQYYTMGKNKINEMVNLTDIFMPYVKTYFCKEKTFNFVAHSLGSVVALELASQLEKEGYVGQIVLLDGSPDLVHKMINLSLQNSQECLEHIYIMVIMERFTTGEHLQELKEKICTAKDLKECLGFTEKYIPIDSDIPKKVLIEMIEQVIDLLKSVTNYQPFTTKLHSKVCLIKPTIPLLKNMSEDLNLNELCANITSNTTVEGNHQSILENESVFEIINNFLIS